MFFISKIFLYINFVAYVVLWFLTIIRLYNFFPKLVSNLTSHEKGPGFFTLIAGTCVFGSQIITVTGNVPIALGLWILGIILWSIIMYTFFTSLRIRASRPKLAGGINGAWLIAAVASQCLPHFGTMLSPYIP